MDLETYLQSTGETQTAFAARVEATVPTINRIIGNQMNPSLALALRIERATDGKVPVAVWADRQTDRNARRRQAA